MAFSLSDVLRFLQGGHTKETSLFKTEQEAYEFCRTAYAESGGVPDELRRSYEFYVAHVDDGFDQRRPATDKDSGDR